MKHVVISVGPIPAKLDSVKLITNKFKGGLALKTAQALEPEFRLTVVAHEGTKIPKDTFRSENTQVIRVESVIDYSEVIRTVDADAYILAGAIANLTPVNPWEGKFPSHHYKEGEVFNIPFTLVPRIIDRVRHWHPHATLIGYKLLDGTEEELIAAGKKTLFDAHAHIVFANHPAWAKERKIALTPDGSIIPLGFDEHVNWIKRVINLQWYQTRTQDHSPVNLFKTEMAEFIEALSVQEGSYLFGTCAIRGPQWGFWTTSRGKQSFNAFTFVNDVDHEERIVRASGKATLNAPTLDTIFGAYSRVKCILHGHRQIEGFPTFDYAFPGTTEEAAVAGNAHRQFNIAHHGYYAAFDSIEEAKTWLNNLPPL